jgi:hypothetical protein
MKLKFSYFLGFTFLLLTGVVFSAHAQEGIPNNEIPDLNFLQPDYQIQEEKPLLFEPSGAEKNSQSREQLNSGQKSAKSKTGDGSKNPAARPEEEDALSFNFLYYIIQKFKISDIVEQ